MAKRKLSPIHPGEILSLEFMEPLGLSQYRLAKSISVPARRINEIVQGKRSISADTALRLSRHFGMSERFWLNLQVRFDLEVEKERLGARLPARKPVEIPVSIDETPPSTSFTSTPDALTNQPTAEFSFRGKDDVTVNRLECRLDADAWEACTSPQHYSGLAAGAHRFTVKAVEPGLGNSCGCITRPRPTASTPSTSAWA